MTNQLVVARVVHWATRLLWPPTPLAGRRPLCFAAADSLFYLFFLSFSPPNLVYLVTDRDQTLPHVLGGIGVTQIYKIRSEILGSPPQNWQSPSIAC